jgi:hypothetical protein
MFISLYLPDKGKGDGCFEALLGGLEQLLHESWLSTPWSGLVVGGDFNANLAPMDGLVGCSCRYNNTLTYRAERLMLFAKHWHIDWSSAFMTHDSDAYTHMRYNTKACSVLDYICVDGSVGFPMANSAKLC